MKLLIDRLLPREVQSRTDKEEPKREKPSKDSEAATLDKLRKDKDEPMSM
jgi:hypothetical protein